MSTTIPMIFTRMIGTASMMRTNLKNDRRLTEYSASRLVFLELGISMPIFEKIQKSDHSFDFTGILFYNRNISK